MSLTRRDSKEIIDYVISEIMRRKFSYVTDGHLDLSKSPAGAVSGTIGGTATGGTIADGAIWNRHVHEDADIRGTKVRVATLAERGTVKLGTDGEAVVPTMSGLDSTVSGLGASLIGVADTEGLFAGDNVEDVLRELFQAVGVLRFLELTDTPDSYNAPWSMEGRVPTINASEDALEFRPVDYIESDFSDDGGVIINVDKIDGGAFNNVDILDGGNF